MNKQTADKIEQAAINALLTSGFKHTPDGWRDYSTDKIGVSVHKDKYCTHRGWFVWIAGVFNDPKEAIAQGIDCNPYTGKYNFHCIETPEQAIYMVSQYKLN